MANFKTGLAYYNVDTDRYQDIKIKRLKKDFGCSGIAIYDYILCQVYRDKGCFLAWDENTAFDVADYFGVKETLINEIVQYCGAVCLFDKELLARGIVTSLSIQSRYIDMCNRAKRKDAVIPKNVKITEESPIIPEECNIITEESPIITEVCDKVKYSKVKNSKENISSNEDICRDEPRHPPPKDDFKKFIADFNQIKGSRYKVTKSVQASFNARLKEGYTAEQMLQVLKNAMLMKNHIESSFQYLTPEFCTRIAKLEMYINNAQTKPVNLGPGEWMQNGKRYYGDKNNFSEAPLDAPKRPSAQYYWNPKLKQWNIQ